MGSSAAMQLPNCSLALGKASSETHTSRFLSTVETGCTRSCVRAREVSVPGKDVCSREGMNDHWGASLPSIPFPACRLLKPTEHSTAAFADNPGKGPETHTQYPVRFRYASDCLSD